MTEQELIKRAQQGDEDAFAQLLVANEKRIFNLCYRLTGNPDDGAELAQEAFLNAWRGLSKFQGDSAFSTWVYRLASNVCIDFLRKEKRRKSISSAVSMDDVDDEHPRMEIPDERYTPERQLEQSEQHRAIVEGLEKISLEHKQVLIMREMNGLSYGEIGEILGLEEGTVKSRIARARTALRKVLQERGNFFSPSTST